MTDEGKIQVKKIAYWQPVNVVDGVPQCPCCQEPMVERPGGWMCALGAALLDAMKPAMRALDDTFVTAELVSDTGNERA